jgi:hypothetical protein
MIKFENAANGRYYYLVVQKDIFDDWVLSVVRGSKSRHIVKHCAYKSFADIERQIAQISKIRLRRGYSLIEY